MERIPNCEQAEPYASHPIATTSSIVRLPSELLIKIFLESQCHRSCPYDCGEQNPPCASPTALASVSRTWRSVSLGLPWLWAHVHLDFESRSTTTLTTDHVQLICQRSAGAHFDLIITICGNAYDWNSDSECDDNRESRGEYPPEMTLQSIIEIVDITNHFASRTQRLEIHTDKWAAYGIRKLLGYVLGSCSSDILRALIVHGGIYNEYHDHDRFLPWGASDSLGLPTEARTNEMLASLRILHLRESHIPWTHTAFHNLTELSIASWRTETTVAKELKGVLSRCPRLRVLRINLNYWRRKYEPKVDPVYLEHLRILVLTCSHPEAIATFLRIIRSTSRDFAVRMNQAGTPKNVEHLQAFYSENLGLTMLHIKSDNTYSWFLPLSCGLQALVTLTLERCDFRDDHIELFLRTQFGKSEHSLWPMLRVLRLKSCWIVFPVLKALLQCVRVDRLILVNCRARKERSVSPVTLNMVQDQLSEHGVDVQIEDKMERPDDWYSVWI